MSDFPPLTLYNTLSRSQEVFKPHSHKTVTLYSCGPTVYDYVHVGNLRAYIFVDILKRTLTYNGYTVNHTLNYTDFGHLTSDADTGEDKMMKGLRREGLPVSLDGMNKLAETYIAAFETDCKALRITPPTQAVRASHFIKEQIALIETLEQKGYTYTTSDGVYFDVEKYPDYGKLGNIDLEHQRTGARVDINEEKRHPADFALWKNGELGWESKWGTGFPGWHIECSAMAFATLGKQIDIHTGGIDHIAVHHNAEIAQCECATGKEFARYWMHNNFLTVNEEKIAKSKGNGIKLQDLLKNGYSADDFRYLLLQSHYRTPVNFSYDALNASHQALTRVKKFFYTTLNEQAIVPNTTYQQRILAAINDDLDTPRVISELHEIIKSDELSLGEKKHLLLEIESILGIGLSEDSNSALKELGHIDISDVPDDIKTLIDTRAKAREEKNWPEADRIRDELKSKGYDVKDTEDGISITKRS